MGEAKRREKLVLTPAMEAMAVGTRGGRIHVQCGHTASASANAQLAFFAEFLAAIGVYDTWVDSCPLSYSSPNAPGKRDVLGPFTASNAIERWRLASTMRLHIICRTGAKRG